MKRARDLVVGVAIVMLGGGYLLSQFAATQGNASAVAAQLDQPPVRLLAAILVLATLVLAILPEPKEPT